MTKKSPTRAVKKLFGRATELQRKGTHSAAIKEFSKAIEIVEGLGFMPSDAALFLCRGKSYAELRRQDRALRDFYKALELNPTYAKAHYNIGASYGEMGRHDEALQSFEKAFVYADRNDSETRAYACLGKGRALTYLGRRAEALEALNQAVTIDPDNYEARLVRGGIYSLLERHDEGLADFLKGIDLAGTQKQGVLKLFRYNCGLACTAKGDIFNALSHFAAAIALDPHYALAYEQRGYAYLQAGQHQQAIADSDKALSVGEPNPHVYYQRSQAYRALGQTDKAEGDFREALKLDPTRAFIKRRDPFHFLVAKNDNPSL